MLLARHGRTRLDDSRILEIGCGNGHWLREFVKWGARPENLTGVDLLPERVAQACRLSPPGMSFSSGSAAALDFADASFDIVFQADAIAGFVAVGAAGITPYHRKVTFFYPFDGDGQMPFWF